MKKIKRYQEFNEDRQQLTLPFKEKKYKGKSVHGHIEDALADLQTMEYEQYRSHKKLDDVINESYEVALEKVFGNGNTKDYDVVDYLVDFFTEYDITATEEYYSKKFVDKCKEYLEDNDYNSIIELATASNLQDEVLTKEGWDAFMELSRDKFDESVAMMIDAVRYSSSKNVKGLFDIWRTVDYKAGIDNDLYNVIVNKYKGVGVYWTWDEDQAQSYWGEGGHKITLHGQVSIDNVDWVETLRKNAYSLKEEKEIKIKDNGDVMIIGYYDEVIKKFKDFEVPIVVTAGQTKDI